MNGGVILFLYMLSESILHTSYNIGDFFSIIDDHETSDVIEERNVQVQKWRTLGTGALPSRTHPPS
jgi:hypothetical protein